VTSPSYLGIWGKPTPPCTLHNRPTSFNAHINAHKQSTNCLYSTVHYCVDIPENLRTIRKRTSFCLRALYNRKMSRSGSSNSCLVGNFYFFYISLIRIPRGESLRRSHYYTVKYNFRLRANYSSEIKNYLIQMHMIFMK
jgi:hypothetical protein